MQDIKELVKYSVTDEALAQYREEFLPLTINGLTDHAGYAKVKDSRLFLRGERTSVEEKRVELKAHSLEYGRAVDKEANRIMDAIREIENHLMAEQKKIDDEVARIKFETEQRAVLPERTAKLAELDATMSEEEVLKLDGPAFVAVLNGFLSEKLEKQRLAQEETERAQRAEKRAIEDKRLEAEREERHRAEVEQAKKEAAERAVLEARAEAVRKEDERIAAESAAKAEAERIEAERPDNEKLYALAVSLSDMQLPEVASKRAKAKVVRVRKVLDDLVVELKAA